MFLKFDEYQSKKLKIKSFLSRLTRLVNFSYFYTMDLPVYFISDIHLSLDLSKQEKNRQETLFEFLHHVEKTGGTLIINGDLFDFYFEYKNVIPKMYFNFYYEIMKIRESGIKVHYILGNHDYWVQDFITDQLFDKTYESDTAFELGNKNFYITHGDGYLSWDKGYRTLRSIIRSKLFISLYRMIHPSIGYAIANFISKKGSNYQHSEDYAKKISNEMAFHAKKRIESGYNYFISGHYHQAEERKINNGKMVILGDWLSFFTYAKFDGDNLKLHYWKNAKK